MRRCLRNYYIKFLEKVEINQEILQANKAREAKVHQLMEPHFEVSCGIGKDRNRPKATRGRRSEINWKNKKIAKILNYNSKRREFIRDDECEENEEKTVWELNFRVKNYGVEGEVSEDKGVKKDGRRKRQAKDKYFNHDIPDDRKMGAVEYYNKVLDKYKKYEILQEWGIFDFGKNPVESIVMETEEEVNFVNSMKVFARYNTCSGHIKMMNSLLLEKNIREYLAYLRHTKTRGRHDEKLVNHISNKRIFKLMANKVQDANLIPNDIIDPKDLSGDEQEDFDAKDAPIIRNYDMLCK